MTGENVLDVAREILSDEDSDNYRWSNATLLGYVQQAQYEGHMRRPDLFLSATSTMTAPAAVASTSTILKLGTQHLGALADFAAGKALREDATDPDNAQRAAVLFQSFYAGIGVTV